MEIGKVAVSSRKPAISNGRDIAEFLLTTYTPIKSLCGLSIAGKIDDLE